MVGLPKKALSHYFRQYFAPEVEMYGFLIQEIKLSENNFFIRF